MPIHKMNFEDGVFFAKQVGYVDSVDARIWANALGNYANRADVSITAIVDMTEVDRVCPTVTKVLGKTLQTANLNTIAIVTGDFMASRNSRIIDKLSAMKGVRIFSTLEDAQRYTKTHQPPAFGGLYDLQNIAMFTAVPAF